MLKHQTTQVMVAKDDGGQTFYKTKWLPTAYNPKRMRSDKDFR